MLPGDLLPFKGGDCLTDVNRPLFESTHPEFPNAAAEVCRRCILAEECHNRQPETMLRLGEAGVQYSVVAGDLVDIPGWRVRPLLQLPPIAAPAGQAAPTVAGRLERRDTRKKRGLVSELHARYSISAALARHWTLTQQERSGEMPAADDFAPVADAFDQIQAAFGDDHSIGTDLRWAVAIHETARPVEHLERALEIARSIMRKCPCIWAQDAVALAAMVAPNDIPARLTVIEERLAAVRKRYPGHPLAQDVIAYRYVRRGGDFMTRIARDIKRYDADLEAGHLRLDLTEVPGTRPSDRQPVDNRVA
jgi:hypothetical protein